MDQSKIYHGGGIGRGSGFGSSAPMSGVKVNFAHTDLQIAALTRSITMYTLPIGGIVVFTRLVPSAAFAGAGITEYWLSIGVAGAIQDIMAEYRVDNVVPGNTEYAESFVPMSFNIGATTDLLISARSVGANLNQSNAGACTIELYYLSRVV